MSFRGSNILLADKSENFWKLISLLLGVFLFLGGLGVELFYIKVYGALVSLLLIGLAWLWKGKVKLPKTFKLYCLFLIFFAISLIWSQDRTFSFEQLLLFLSGGLFWIAFYNLSSEFGRWMDKLVITLGLVFGGLFIINHFWGMVQVRPWSLFLPYTAYLNHNNVGDLWAVVLTIVVFNILEKSKRLIYWLLAGLGVYFLFMGQSRSSYVSLAVGAFYLFKGRSLASKYRKILAGFIFLAAVLFIFTGAFKTTLFIRPYYVQTLVGLVHNPLGVGVGNFGLISADPENWIFGLSDPSIVVHNIILEMMAGMGVLGIIFAAWLLKVLIYMWREKDVHGLVYRAVFFALTANFLFHSTYFVPAMLWLWFLFLGISQGEALLKNRIPS